MKIAKSMFLMFVTVAGIASGTAHGSTVTPRQCWYSLSETEAPYGCMIHDPNGNIIDAILCVNPTTGQPLSLEACDAMCAVISARCTASLPRQLD